MEIKWYIRFYHRFRIYVPVMVIFLILGFVYGTYMKNYIIPLLLGDNSHQLQPMIFFAGQYSKTYSYNIGLVLCIISSWSVFLMVISILKTTFMDPGYLPSPTELEFNLLKKNLDFPDVENAQRLSINESGRDIITIEDSPAERKLLLRSNSLHNRSNSLILTDKENKSLNHKRFEFIRNFTSYVKEGPLTTPEFLQYRVKLERFLVPNTLTDVSYCSNTSLSMIETSHNNSHFFDQLEEKPTQINYDDVFENFRGIDLTKLHMCPNCLRWKCERAHHCRQCGKCVLKMDHHCPWLANCIGFKNYKFFCLIIVYGLITTSLVFLSFWEVVFTVNLRSDSTLSQCTVNTFAYICNFGMLCFMIYLLNINWTCVFKNQTVIERADKERFCGNVYNYHHYDQGKWKNFTSVFGNNPLFWFFPICPNYKGNGILWETM
jgi:hypothetical protein